MEILEGLSGHGLLRTKRMCLDLHPNVLLDALPQLSCHSHPQPDAIYAMGAAKSAASYTPFSPPLPSSIANPLFEFMVLNRNDTDSTYAIWL